MKRIITIIAILSIIGKISAQDSTLVLYYPLNDIYTNYVLDESGNNNRGLAYNTLPAKDRFGFQDKALYFFGDSFINFEAETFNFNEYTYALWARIIDQPSYASAQFLFDIGSDYGVDQYIAYTNGYSLYDLYGYLGQGYNTDSSSVWISQGNLIYDEDWHFIVYTRSANFIKLYIDSEIIDSLNTQETIPIYGGNIKGYIGCRNNYTQYFRGYIDDIRLYNYAISQSDITELFGYFITDVKESIYSELSVYPNPTSNKLTISINEEIINYHIDVLNILGEKVFSAENINSIDVSDFSKGIYLLRLQNHDTKEVISSKFIKN